MAANYKLVCNPDPANSDELKPLHNSRLPTFFKADR